MGMISASLENPAQGGRDKDREVYWSGDAQAIKMTAEVPVLLGKTNSKWAACSPYSSIRR
jgi:hypothetical protein